MINSHKGTQKSALNQILVDNLVNNSPLNVDVSFYKSYFDNVGTKCNLFDFLTTNKYRQQVEQVRTVTDKKQRDKIKQKLPAVTVSGLFEKRNLQSICTPTNLICLDFDGVPNLDGLFNHLKTLPYILCRLFS